MNSDGEREVIEQMLDITEANSIMRLVLDWDDVWEVVLDSYDDQGFNFAVRLLLKELGDDHSFYLTPSNLLSLSGSDLRCNRTFII